MSKERVLTDGWEGYCVDSLRMVPTDGVPSVVHGTSGVDYGLFSLVCVSSSVPTNFEGCSTGLPGLESYGRGTSVVQCVCTWN